MGGGGIARRVEGVGVGGKVGMARRRRLVVGLEKKGGFGKKTAEPRTSINSTAHTPPSSATNCFLPSHQGSAIRNFHGKEVARGNYTWDAGIV